MYRTVSQMHDDLDFLIDKVRTPRFSQDQRDRTLNMAQDRIIQDRYDNIRKNTGYSFQSLQRVRDELRPIVVEHSITPDISQATFDLPDDYRHEVLLEVILNTTTVTSTPMSHDEKGIISQDPYDTPTNEEPRHMEKTGKTVKVFFEYGYFVGGTLYYLRNPKPISFDDSQDSELPGHLHDELLELASQIINGTVENINRYKIAEKEAKAS